MLTEREFSIGTVLDKEIPCGVNRSDLQAHRLVLTNINFYFMLKYHRVSVTQWLEHLIWDSQGCESDSQLDLKMFWCFEVIKFSFSLNYEMVKRQQTSI